MRKAFNFYRSYYEVAKELSEKDRAAFLWAILQKQFEGIEPNLKGLASFAYLSQKYNIDTQVSGYEAKTKTKLTPSEPPLLPPTEPPSVQEKEKEKEKVELTIKKIKFNDSEIFDKVKFKEKFPDWNREKLAYYYDSALRYSNEGNKYIDWEAAVKNWAKKDEMQGRLKFDAPKQAIYTYTDGLL